ncbi:MULTISPECIES: hypothetical protein [unclassified Calothrix]|uniref:hypothetical protein n=1 Tax=unclassified Calothrix TaxID=2619626 RepID=UPI0016864947|nr:hypothetical protein [Calothrix sp. FACHB-168]MBD2207380.1 hypothetical protein [Calothrix sp. FACHB-168]
MGFVQLAAPFEGDGGLLGKRVAGGEGETFSPSGFHVKLTPMGSAMPLQFVRHCVINFV